MVSMFTFTKFADKKFRKLDVKIQIQLGKRLAQVRESGSMTQCEPLRDYLPATHRLRPGDFRFILARDGDTNWIVLDIGHRKEIYR